MKTVLRFLFGGGVIVVALFYLWFMWRVLLFMVRASRKRKYYVLLDARGYFVTASTGLPAKMQHGQRQYLVRARDIEAACILAQTAFKKSYKDHGHEALGDANE